MSKKPDTLYSMTGFASGEGQAEGFTWSWELRSVNGKGLDLRLRVPDWVTGLEAALRKRLSQTLGRGSVTLNLRLTRASGGNRLAVNEEMLDIVLEALSQVEQRAMTQGQSLSPATAADVLALRGVLDVAETSLSAQAIAALCTALLEDFETVLQAFLASRAQEGAATAVLLTAHLDDIDRLTTEATDACTARSARITTQFNTALSRVSRLSDEVSEDRIAQELAVLAVKSDVTEELDRLGAHIAAARALMCDTAPVGRRFDFLMQEFNREANTLCSKSGDSGLTAIGLELKTKIDQLREQVQNVE